MQGKDSLARRLSSLSVPALLRAGVCAARSCLHQLSGERGFGSRWTRGRVPLAAALKMCAGVVLAAPVTGLWQSLCPPALSGR